MALYARKKRDSPEPGANQICSGGSCIASCSDECSTVGQRECDGSGYKECGNFDADSCKEWKHFDCQTNETCSNGSCNKKIPTVDLNASGTAACNRTATLTWISTNADSCSAAGAWSGTKATSGTENTGNFTGSKTYTLTCSNAGGSASDSVTINGQGDTLNASAGADMDVDAGESIQLNGSVSGDGFGGQANISWSCTGGTLSNRNALRPTFTTDDGDGDETYTCTMTATNECGTDSDTMKVTVNKRTSNFKVNLTAQSDCAPLNDVDLVAKLSNYSGNDYDYTYYFDCDNDGDWEKTVTTSKTSYTAENLCNYRKVGEYTAKVKVTSHDRTVTDTARVNAENCEKQIEQKGNVSITKTVMNVSKGSIYSGSVTADPGDAVSYRIVVTGSNGAVNNVTLRDSMPSGVANIRDLRVDGAAGYGNIESGIDLGTLSSGQSKIVTFTATVAGESYFAYGQTTLTNIATVTADGLSASSNAAVYVYRRAVQGATIVSTGFDGNIFAGIGAAIAGAILSLGWSLSHFLKGKKMTAEELLSQKINSIKQNSLA